MCQWHTHTHDIYVYICYCWNGSLCWIWRDDKITGKMDKSDSHKGFSSNDISFFISTISSD